MRKGVLYIILSGLSFFVVNFLVKMLGNPAESPIKGLQKFPAHELVLVRGIISFSISAYFLKRKGLSILGKNRKWLFLRGMFGMIALTLFFLTIHTLPIAIASTLQYLSPIFTVLLGALIFREELRKVSIILSIIAFIGVVLIGFQNFFEEKTAIPPIWILIGIVSAFFSGLAYNAIGQFKGKEEPLNIVVYFPMLSIPVMGIWCIFDFVMPQGIEWIILILIGIFTQIAQVLMTKAFLEESTATLAPFQYLGAIYALLLGWFVFDEKLSFLSVFGILLILFGVLANNLFKKK